MGKNKSGGLSKVFASVADKVTRATGSPVASIIAMIIVIVWALLGPVFKFSDTWQLVINTGTTIITFLMVFIIQQSQNKDTLALQLKLNELLASSEKASNKLIDIEELTEEDLVRMRKYYQHLFDMAREHDSSNESHSIEEAEEIALQKQKRVK